MIVRRPLFRRPDTGPPLICLVILLVLILCSNWAVAAATTTNIHSANDHRHNNNNNHHEDEGDTPASAKLHNTMFDGPPISSSHRDTSDYQGQEFGGGGQFRPRENQVEANHDYHDVAEQMANNHNRNHNDDNQPDTVLSTDSLDHHLSKNNHQNHHANNGDDDAAAGSEAHLMEASSSHDYSPDSLNNNIQPITTSLIQGKQKTIWKEMLDHALADEACKLDRGCQRRDRLNNTYLSYCTRYKLENLFSSQILMSIMHKSPETCQTILDEFIQLDETINLFYELFKKLLTRYNCHNGYSVKWTCEDCKRAYQDWLCATSLPYYMKGERIKPCISFCERVEQRCPYLHPITKEQYGGQPVFICRDPNIPFVPEITPDIPYSEPSKCYDLCHLSQNRTELYIDSLSKYDPDKCPDKNLVAEQVRNDTTYCPKENKTSSGASVSGNDGGQDITDDESSSSVATGINGTGGFTETPSTSTTSADVHMKKLHELREVLAIYKSQPKTHKFGHHLEHS